MKKYVALFLAVILLLALVACGPGASSPEQTEEAAGPPATEAPETEAPEKPAESEAGNAGETGGQTGLTEVEMPLVDTPYTFTYWMPIP